MITTPDGRAVWVPDFLMPAQQDPGLTPPAPMTPEEIAYGDRNYVDALSAVGMQPDPRHITDPGVRGQVQKGMDAQGLYKSIQRDHAAGQQAIEENRRAGYAQHRTDVARIAQNTAPIGTTTTMGRDTDPGQPSAGMPTPTFTPEQLAQLQPDPKPLTPEQKNAQAQQAAFNASPEGQIRQAGADAAGAVQDQGALARQQAGVESAELTDIAANEREGQIAADKVRAEAAAEQAARQAGLKEKTQQYDAAVKAEADYKIDDNRRWKQIGTGRTILFWISAALSGLGDAINRKSGPNMALQIMNQAIESDVAAQVREREALGRRIGTAKNSIDGYRQITGDIQDAAKLKLSEEYDRTAAQIRATAAKYGSEKAKIRGESLAVQFEQQAAGIRGTTAEGAFNRDMARAQLGLQQGQLANSQQNTRIAGGHLNLATKQFKEGIRQFDKRMQLDAAQLDVEAQKAAAAGLSKAGEAIRELGVVGPPQLVTDADGNITGIDRNQGALKNADGSAWLLPTKEEAIKYRSAKANADELIDIIDEIRAIRDRSGGSSDWANSDDNQRVKKLAARATLIAKQGTEGMSSENDVKIITTAAGVNDPTSFRAQGAGLDEARERIVKGINYKAKGLGYTGAPFEYADPTKLAPEMQAEDRAFKDSLKAPGFWQGTEQEETEGKPSPGSPYARDFEAIQRYKTEGTTKAQRATIEGLVTTATDGKSQSQRDAARARLQQGAQQGQTDAIKQAYRAALMSLQSGDAKTSGEEIGPTVR